MGDLSMNVCPCCGGHIVGVRRVMLNRGTMTAHYGQLSVKMTATYFDIMEVMAEAAPNAVSKNVLMDLWKKRGTYCTPEALRTHMCKFRFTVERLGLGLRASRAHGYTLTGFEVVARPMTDRTNTSGVIYG
jgi:DNA-binding response OmpR family regulator